MNTQRFAARLIDARWPTLIIVAIALWPTLATGQGTVELIPREVFFGNPTRTKVQVSPDGTRLSYLAPHRGVLNVWVERLDGTESTPITNSSRSVREYFWAINSEQIIYAQDRNGNENDHLFAVDLGSGQERDLTPYPGIKAFFVGAARKIPDEILVAMNNRVPQLHDVWRINTRTGERTRVLENNQNLVNFIADQQLNVRLASRYRADGGLISYFRDPDGPWYELARWDVEDAATSGPLGIARDGRTVYLKDSRKVNTARLYQFTASTDDEGSGQYTLLAHDDRVDIGPIVFNAATGRPQAIAFDYLRRQWQLLDGSIRADWDYLTDVTDGELAILSRDLEDETWIVSYARDDGPVEFYQYDRPQRRAEFLFTNRSDLAAVPLTRMTPQVIPARDGLNMVSYLTVPLHVKTEMLPMVLLVHGGPWTRDRFGYHPLHQWLANRGYAVLSVNYRGSAGFGKAYLNAGNTQWSGRMQDDLIDAVNWAVEEGIADPDRVAIMGASYGGYATLVGLTFTPEFFAAGVDIAGPAHVPTLLNSIPPYLEPVRALFETRVGQLDHLEYLESISPLNRVDAITRPLLIGQGGNDPRATVDHSRQIVTAMQNRELDVTYVLFPDEGHRFARAVNNLAFFAITEAFLAKHLGGRAQPLGGEIRKSSAEIHAGQELIPGLREALRP